MKSPFKLRAFGFLRSLASRNLQDFAEPEIELESLEPRVLFSAAPVETPIPDVAPETAEEQVDVPSEVVSPETGSAPESRQSDPPKEAVFPEPTGDSEISPTQGITLVAVDTLSAQANQEIIQKLEEQSEGPREIAFVSSEVHDYQTLVSNLESDVEVFVINGNQDGVSQVSEILAGRVGVEAIHLFTHGSSGALQLGTASLDGASMTGIYDDEISAWRGALSQEADLFLYGCSIGAGQAGQDFLSLLANQTGADVAASNDDTGSANLGGDWDLEVAVGSIEFAALGGGNWNGILAPMNISASTNPTSGGGNGAGAWGLWSNAGTIGGTAIDIRATVTSATSGAVITFARSGDDLRLQVRNGEMTVNWEVFQSGTGQSVVAFGDPNFSIRDLDGSGGNPNTIEYVTADLDGLTSYTVESPTTLQVSNPGDTLRVDGTQNRNGQPDSMVTLGWTNVSSWTVTYGAISTSDRWFIHDGDGDFSFANPTTIGIPTLDLDANDSTATGNGYNGSFVENGGGVPIVDTDLTITNSGTRVDGATIKLTNAKAGDQVLVGSLPAGIAAAVNTSVAGEITVTLTGTTSPAAYQLALHAITFNNTSEDPESADRLIDITLQKGGRSTAPARSTIAVNPIDDVVTIGDVTVAEDGTLTFTATSSHIVAGGFTVDVSTFAGSADGGGVDYVDMGNQTLTFAGLAGETQTFTVNGADDFIIESDETFTVVMSNVTNGAVDISDTAVGTLLDNDARPAGIGVTTDVELVANGAGGFDLVIEDVETDSLIGFASAVPESDSSDDLLIERIGGNYVIRDRGGLALGSPIVGAIRGGDSEIRIPVALVTGDIIIRTGVEDDLVTVDDLGATISGGLFIDTEDRADRFNDFDVIDYNSDSTMAAGRNAEFRAETINGLVDAQLEAGGEGTIYLDAGRNIWFDEGSNLTSADGDVTLEANLSGTQTGTFIAVRLRAASIDSGTGDVVLEGRGGTTGHYNRGIQLENLARTGVGSTIRTSGSITLTGTGGGSGLQNTGVLMDKVTVVESSGSGPVTISGTGGDGSMMNDGVSAFKGTVIDGGTGNVVIAGTGAATGTFSRGIHMGGAVMVKSDGGDIALDGVGGGAATGMFGKGIDLADVDLLTNGTGTITLRGTGNTGTLGNMGTSLASGSTVSTVDGAIRIEGTGDGSTLLNHGVHLRAKVTVVASGTGTVTLVGTAGAGSTENVGVEISHSTVSVADGKLTVLGTGRGTGLLNRGVNLPVGKLVSTGAGDIEVVGTGSVASAGAINHGVFFDAASANATGSGNIAITGTGGTGNSGNNGVSLHTRSAVSTAFGNVTLTGTGGGSGASAGISIAAQSSVSAGGAGAVTIAGTGANGTLLNSGVLIASFSTVTVADGDLSVSGTGRGSASLNDGVKLSHATLSATGDGNLTVSGTGSQTASGLFNTGINMLGGSIATASGNLTLTGQSGTGSTLNQGVRVAAASLETTGGGTMTVSGTSASTTTGLLNTGAYLMGVTLGGGGSVTINGTGGGGTMMNHGIYMGAITVTGSAPVTSGVVGSGMLSKSEDGNFFG